VASLFKIPRRVDDKSELLNNLDRAVNQPNEIGFQLGELFRISLDFGEINGQVQSQNFHLFVEGVDLIDQFQIPFTVYASAHRVSTNCLILSFNDSRSEDLTI